MIDLKVLLTKIMTSFVSLEKTTAQYIHGQIYRVCSNVDATKANNNVTATQFPSTFIMADKDNRVLARVEGRVYPAGDIGIFMFARNYDTNGDTIGPQCGLEMTVTKAGVPAYRVTHPEPFREAIGIAEIDTSTLSDFFEMNTSNVTEITSQHYVQYGRVVQVGFFWKNKNAISVDAAGGITDVAIGTLKTGKRPAMASVGMSNGNSQQWYYIPNTGEVRLTAMAGNGSSRTIAAGSNFNFFATFILP